MKYPLICFPCYMLQYERNPSLREQNSSKIVLQKANKVGSSIYGSELVATMIALEMMLEYR